MQNRWPILLFGGGLELALALAAAVLGWLFELPPWASTTWDGRDALLGVAAALPMFALFIAGMRWPVGPVRRIRQVNVEFIRPLFEPCSLIDLAGLSALAGVGEEWFFRGFLQAGLSEWLNPWLGWMIANAVFGLLHALTATYAVVAALAGFYFAWLWHISGNLLTPIIAHAVYDWLALAYLTRFTKVRSSFLNPCQGPQTGE
jgi:membrane protease YdiL (CAAX protease family)